MDSWQKIKDDYISGGGNYRELADKYSVPYGALCRRAAVEKWVGQRKLRRVGGGAPVDAGSPDAEDALRRRIRAEIFAQIEERLSRDELDGGEFRRLVQSYIDMTQKLDGPADNSQVEGHNRLIEAILKIND